MKVFTIGFTKKSAEDFFGLLIKNEVRLILDTRLNNVSQLAGFAKGKDLEYFCEKIVGIPYIHDKRFAPSSQMLDSYRKREITWNKYEERYLDLLMERDVLRVISEEYINKMDSVCILCSEDTPDKCHRRLLADYIRSSFPLLNIEIVHLI